MTDALVFTDLDGTLLDHHSYDWWPAAPALERLAQRQVPVILNTSKTQAETAQWHARLELTAPYVVENGAAVHAPDGRLMLTLGRPRGEILEILGRLRAKLACDFAGFADVDADTVCAWTGLRSDEAERARARAWSEPLRWQDDEAALARFRVALDEAGLRLLRGGRFFHVQGLHDKGLALTRLVAGPDWPGATSVALGDGENDVAMLRAADIAVCIRSPAHGFPRIADHPRLLHSRAAGPAGWGEAINTLIDKNFFRHE